MSAYIADMTSIENKSPRNQFGLNQDAEVEITPTAQGLLIEKQEAAQHPVDSVCGILDGNCEVDKYLEEIRGR